ncbi:MAG TPA: polysaccharide lyase family 8 super-sandwich domain-containing protein [Paludibacter sp.]|jgi:chondroitin AC lyase|nr:MAG: Chondroitinase-AC precursor [Bacteroidetes bacterium ADurb.Bin174]HQB27467.1 polysaccharide lyase family 8 super-sandwich domain-containing protein [Paludibacter sp.]
MKPLHKLICSLIILFFIQGKISPQNQEDLNTIKTRLFNSVMSQAAYNLANQNVDGTFVNVTYPASYPTDFTGGPRPHLTEMYVIAVAYHTRGEQYKSPDLLEAYVKAWNWWHTTNPTDANWWYRSIGFPNSLISSYLLMADELKTHYPEAFTTATNYLLAEWTPQFYAEALVSPDGANTSDVTYYTFAASVTAKVDSIITQTAEVLTNLIEIQTTPKGEGIHPDYSFSAHTGTARQLYLGNYGKEYMGGIIRFMLMTDDTYLEVPPEKVTIFENLFLEGASWVAYRGIFDHHQHGRRVMPTDGYVKTLNCLNSLIQLNTPQKEKLQELSNWMSRSFEDSENNVQQGNRMYWRHDYMVHKGKNYFTSNRMSSTRVLCSESANGEGLSNYYTGSGINYIYITGQEYLEFWDDMNWRRLPGLTAPQKETTVTLPTVPPTSQRGLNGDSYAGGTTDGETGVTGFKYNKVHKTEVNVTATKGNFYFKDYFVVLGNSVKAGRNEGVPFTTTVNQVKFKDNFKIDNAGIETNLTVGQTLAPTTSDRAYLNNIGYQFIKNTNLNFEVKTIGSSNIAWLAFNHGNIPNNDTYAYAVYPNITEEEFNTKLNEKRFEVVSNTASNLCVIDTIDNIAQIAFILQGTLNLPKLVSSVTVNVPLMVQLKQQEDTIFMNVANPYCETRNIAQAYVTLGGLFEGDGADMDVENNKTQILIPMRTNEFQGSTVNVKLTKKITSGIKEINADLNALSVTPSLLNAGDILRVNQKNRTNDEYQYQIYQMDGSIVKQETRMRNSESSFNISTIGLNKGMYLIRMNGQSAKFILK